MSETSDSSRSSNTSGEIGVPLSKVPADLASSYLNMGATVAELQSNQKSLDSFFKIEKNIPSSFLKNFYKDISEAFRTFGLPDSNTKEARVSKVAALIFKSVCVYFQDRLQNEKGAFRLDDEKWLKWTFNDVQFNGKMNFSFDGKKNVTGRRTVFVVECKAAKHTLVVGLQQAFLYLKRIWEFEGAESFAILFNGFQFKLVQMKASTFVVSQDYPVAFGAMGEKTSAATFEEEWIKNEHSSMFARVLYTLVHQALVTKNRKTHKRVTRRS